MGLDFEAAVVGVEQRDGAGGAFEVGEQFAEDARQHKCGILTLKTERGDAAERGLIGEGKGGGGFHAFEHWGIRAEGQKFCVRRASWTQRERRFFLNQRAAAAERAVYLPAAVAGAGAAMTSASASRRACRRSGFSTAVWSPLSI